MASNVALPPGFVLDQEPQDAAALPPGFVLDEPDQPAVQTETAQPKGDSFLKDVSDVALEGMAGANKAALASLDFLGPDQINAVLKLAGSEKRVPTLSEAGQAGTQGGFMEPGLARDIVSGAGQMLPAAVGMKAVPGRDLATVGGAAAEILGAGTATVAQPLKQGAAAVAGAVGDALPSKAREAAKLPLLRQSGDVAAAGYKLDDVGRVIKDKVQQTALKAGLDEGAVAMIASSNKATKSRIKDMIDVIEKGRGNLEYRNFNTPSKVVGEAITDRLKIIQTANKQAAQQLDNVANSLKGQPVDVSPAINNFIEKLANEGIGFDPKTGALSFADSSIEGLPGAQSIIKTVVNRLYNTKSPSQNAYRVHVAKKFIDEQVSYGKSQAGLSGKMEGLIKELRRNLDGILDKNFPTYDRVNSIYSETRGVIDDLQGLAGKKVNLYGENVDKALGTMSRKVLSNYNTGTAMEDLFKSMDEVSRRYSTPLKSSVDDELLKLISTEAELRKLFPTAIKPNTFQGEIGRETARAAGDLAMGNKIGLLNRVGNMAGKVFSKSDEDKLKALRELVSE